MEENVEDLVWLIEKIMLLRQHTRTKRTTRQDIFRGSYDCWELPTDGIKYEKIMNNRLIEAKNLGLIINESGNDEIDWRENWLITDLGIQFLTKHDK